MTDKTYWYNSGPIPLLIMSIALSIGTVAYWYWASSKIKVTTKDSISLTIEKFGKKDKPKKDDKKELGKLKRIEEAIENKEWEKAIEIALACKESPRRDALLSKARFGLWQKLGREAEDQGKLVEAAQCYGKAVSFYNDSALSIRLRMIDETIQKSINDEKFYNELIAHAERCEKMEAWDEALASYKKLLPKAKDKDAIQNKIKACERQMMLIEHIDKLNKEARKLEQEKKWDEAIKVYEKILPLTSDGSSIQKRIKACMERKNEKEQADQFLKELMEMAKNKHWGRILAALKNNQVSHPDLESLKKQAEDALKKDMAFIPAGVFMMGDDKYPEERPKRIFSIPDFYIDKYEVTNEDYQKFVEATETSPPPHWKGYTCPQDKKNHPVVEVSAIDAQSYAEWIGKRLPTEAEWEKAARGDKGWVYPWGNEFDPRYCNTYESHKGGTMPVGSFPEGVSPYGCFDMAGNALEWTSDIYAPYPGGDSPTYPHPNIFVARGGSWYYHGASARCSNRFPQSKEARLLSLGFRCAIDGGLIQRIPN